MEKELAEVYTPRQRLPSVLFRSKTEKNNRKTEHLKVWERDY